MGSLMHLLVFVVGVGAWTRGRSLVARLAQQHQISRRQDELVGRDMRGHDPHEALLCDGTAAIAFTEHADGSIKGTILSITYSQWNGDPTPAGFQPNVADPRAGDTFQLQHSWVHLLYTTWFGRLSALNNNNRYWCDSYALKAGWKECGA